MCIINKFWLCEKVLKLHQKYGVWFEKVDFLIEK
jgi:hypothetical protein